MSHQECETREVDLVFVDRVVESQSQVTLSVLYTRLWGSYGVAQELASVV